MNFNIYQTKNQQHLEEYQRQQSFQGRPIRYSRPLLPISSSKNKTGHWNQKQNAKYYAFLAKFKEKFTEKQVRRQWKVFKALSEFIQSRNANQCRSHHHKMQKNFRTIEETLEYLKKKRPGLQKLCQKYTQQLQKLEYKVFGERNYQQDNGNQNMNIQFAIGQNQIAENQIKNAQLGKINLIPTADKYDQDNQPYGINDGQYGPILSKNSFDVFPSTGLLMNTFPSFQYSYQQPLESYSTINTRQLSMPTNMYNNRNAAYEQKLLECHTCFIKWITKLKNIIQQYSQQLKQKSSIPVNDKLYYNFF